MNVLCVSVPATGMMRIENIELLYFLNEISARRGCGSRKTSLLNVVQTDQRWFERGCQVCRAGYSSSVGRRYGVRRPRTDNLDLTITICIANSWRNRHWNIRARHASQ